MIKWLSCAVIFFGCGWIFKADNECRTYYPYLYEGNDSTLISSFVLVNNSGCTKDQIDKVVSHIASQRPQMILTLRTTFNQAFKFGETLTASIVACDFRVSRFRTSIFKRRLSEFGLDTTSIPNQAYINFFNGAYKKMHVISCRDYETFRGYGGRIVIVGEMGSDSIVPVSDYNEYAFRVPHSYEGEGLIYENQLLAVIVNSLVSKELIVDMPFGMTLSIFAGVVLILLILGDFVIRKPWMLVTKMFVFKLIQLFVLVLVFLFLFVASLHLNYVCDFNLFVASILVGGELSFWVIYLTYRLKAHNGIGDVGD